jgi:hypothetical protein
LKNGALFQEYQSVDNAVDLFGEVSGLQCHAVFLVSKNISVKTFFATHLLGQSPELGTPNQIANRIPRDANPRECSDGGVSLSVAESSVPFPCADDIHARSADQCNGRLAR